MKLKLALCLALALPACTGIPIPDSDGDGIPDLIDPCPQNPDPSCVPEAPPAESYDCDNPPALTGLVRVRQAIPGSYIVVQRPGARAVKARSLAADVTTLAVINGFVGRLDAKGLAEALSDPAVQYIQANGRKKLIGPPPMSPNRIAARAAFDGDSGAVLSADHKHVASGSSMAVTAGWLALRSEAVMLGRVLGSGHESQVGYVDAKPRTASVVDVHSRRDPSVEQYVGDAMGVHGLLALDTESAVAMRPGATGPKDTAGLFGGSDVVKEPHGGGGGSDTAALVPGDGIGSERARVGVMRHDESILTSAAEVEWNLDRIDQRDLPLDGHFEPVATGESVHVYVNDTGVTRTADLADRLSSECFSTIVFRGCDDAHGHGTHVASTAAGTRWGVAKKAVVHSVRFLDEKGSGTDADAIRSLDWIAGHAPGEPGVVNASWGGDPAPAVDAAVCKVIAAGKTFVAAAGNDTRDSKNSTPARIKQVITVGATDNRDRLASFSNFGDGVDLLAPGVDIESAKPDGGSQRMSGTSMACPHVVGAAALYLGLHPGSSPAVVGAGLLNAATPGKVGGLPEGTPNALVYVGGGGAPPGGSVPAKGVPVSSERLLRPSGTRLVLLDGKTAFDLFMAIQCCMSFRP